MSSYCYTRAGCRARSLICLICRRSRSPSPRTYLFLAVAYLEEQCGDDKVCIRALDDELCEAQTLPAAAVPVFSRACFSLPLCVRILMPAQVDARDEREAHAQFLQLISPFPYLFGLPPLFSSIAVK